MHNHVTVINISAVFVYLLSQYVYINQEIHKLPLERVGGAVAGPCWDVQEDVLLQD